MLDNVLNRVVGAPKLQSGSACSLFTDLKNSRFGRSSQHHSFKIQYCMKSLTSSAPASETSKSHAEKAVANAAFLVDEAGLELAAEHWQSANVIGLDTEFVREKTFRARPGLVQISNASQIWLADAVAMPHMPTLAGLLSDTSKTKVLHSVGEDLEVLQQLTGALPEPLFDTQIAAAMLGLPLQYRHESLVEEIFSVHLPGGKARNDWCRRPLAPALLEYAAQDVIWLPALHDHLSEQLDHQNRLAWLEEDCRRIVEDTRRGIAPPALSRIKGAGRLPDEVLTILEALADWREAQAIERDLPRRFVLSDEALIELASSALKSGAAQAVSTLKPGMRHRHGDRLVELIETCDATDFQRPAWLNALDSDQRERLKQVQHAVRELAEELNVDPALIASKKELTRVIRGEQPEWLNGWRGVVLEERLKAASVNISPS